MDRYSVSKSSLSAATKLSVSIRSSLGVERQRYPTGRTGNHSAWPSKTSPWPRLQVVDAPKRPISRVFNGGEGVDADDLQYPADVRGGVADHEGGSESLTLQQGAYPAGVDESDVR